MSEKRKDKSLFDFIERPAEPRGSNLEDALLKLIRDRGEITKDEILDWAKKRGYKVGELMRALDSLTKSRRLTKRLNDEGQLIYRAE